MNRPLLLSLLLAAPLAAADKPNILFILADDMGWQDLSVPMTAESTKFNRRYATPALERLAASAATFPQAYSCAVCSPTRVSLLTGQSTLTHHVTNWTYLSGEQPSSDLEHPRLSHADWNWNGLQPEPMEHAVSTTTLPGYLGAAGYRTMIFGKGHLGAADTPGADPKNLGFEVRIGGRDAGGCGNYGSDMKFGAKRNPDGPWRAWDLDHYFDQDIHLTEALTREAAREIREAVAADEPFFCFFAHYAPHTPIEPDERFAPAFREAGLDETEAAYASLLSGVDKSVGDLLDLLDELGIADDTIVVFTSDNGGVSHRYRSMEPPPTHNRPLSSGKGSHHEGGIRVPLMVRWPELTEAGSTIDTPVIIHDWFPTLLAAAGTEPERKHRVDGLDLRPALRGDELPERPLYWHFPNFWGGLNRPPAEGPGLGACSAIRDGDWKLIHYHNPGAEARFELFNLAEDLGETNNLANKRPEVVRRLATALGDRLRATDAPMPVIEASGETVAWPDAAFSDDRFERISFEMPERCDRALALDVDGDQDLDLVGICRTRVVAVILPERETRVLADLEDGGMIHGATWDADLDGDTDLAVVRFGAGEKVSDFSVAWLENPGWKLHPVDSETGGVHGIAAGDLDGDGRDDLVAANVMGAFPKSLSWYPGSGGGRLFIREVDAGDRPHYPAIDDIDGDGRNDVFLGAGNGFSLFLNPGPEAIDQDWPLTRIDDQSGGTNVAIADIDGDGDLDLIGANGHGTGIRWYENPGWKPHVVDAALTDVHALDSGDLDGDGDPDLAAGAFGGYQGNTAIRKLVRWYENDGQGGFTPHPVDTEHQQESYALEIVDVDRDGANDLVLGGRASNNLVWYRNLSK